MPFARYVALHGVGGIRRYHCGKVYRRDQPQAARGRFREFFQCDFDIAGSDPLMLADAEVLKVKAPVLSVLDACGQVPKSCQQEGASGMHSLACTM